MITVIQSHQFARHKGLLDKMFRLRKQVFHDQLNWDVSVQGPWERDAYDEIGPAYLVWTDRARKTLYGSIRLMPTTGPTLLYDVFRRTFPEKLNLMEPGIWEGTRMCIDEQAIARDFPEIDAGRAFCLLLLALCEVALAYGIHTMVSNYEPHLKRFYRKAGAELEEIGQADGFGRRPVCCGLFEVSERVLTAMREKLGVTEPMFERSALGRGRHGWGAAIEARPEAVLA